MCWIRCQVVWFPCWMWKFHWKSERSPLPSLLACVKSLLTSIPSWYLSRQSTVSSHLEKSRWQEESAFRRHPVIWAIQTTLQFFIALSLVYIPSRNNLMDAPSRALSASTCTVVLSWLEWNREEDPHSIFLLALVWRPFWCSRLPLDISHLVYQRVHQSYCSFLSDTLSFGRSPVRHYTFGF